MVKTLVYLNLEVIAASINKKDFLQRNPPEKILSFLTQILKPSNDSTGKLRQTLQKKLLRHLLQSTSSLEKTAILGSIKQDLFTIYCEQQTAENPDLALAALVAAACLLCYKQMHGYITSGLPTRGECLKFIHLATLDESSGDAKNIEQAEDIGIAMLSCQSLDLNNTAAIIQKLLKKLKKNTPNKIGLIKALTHFSPILLTKAFPQPILNRWIAALYRERKNSTEIEAQTAAGALASLMKYLSSAEQLDLINSALTKLQKEYLTNHQVSYLLYLLCNSIPLYLPEKEETLVALINLILMKNRNVHDNFLIEAITCLITTSPNNLPILIKIINAIPEKAEILYIKRAILILYQLSRNPNSNNSLEGVYSNLIEFIVKHAHVENFLFKETYKMLAHIRKNLSITDHVKLGETMLDYLQKAQNPSHLSQIKYVAWILNDTLAYLEKEKITNSAEAFLDVLSSTNNPREIQQYSYGLITLLRYCHEELKQKIKAVFLNQKPLRVFLTMLYTLDDEPEFRDLIIKETTTLFLSKVKSSDIFEKFLSGEVRVPDLLAFLTDCPKDNPNKETILAELFPLLRSYRAYLMCDFFSIILPLLSEEQKISLIDFWEAQINILQFRQFMEINGTLILKFFYSLLPSLDKNNCTRLMDKLQAKLDMENIYVRLTTALVLGQLPLKEPVLNKVIPILCEAIDKVETHRGNIIQAIRNISLRSPEKCTQIVQKLREKSKEEWLFQTLDSFQSEYLPLPNTLSTQYLIP